MALGSVAVDFPSGVYADVRLERATTARILLQDGRLEDVSERVVTGAMLRVLRGGRWIFAATTDLSDLSAALRALAAGPAPEPGGIDAAPLLQPHRGRHLRFSESRIDAVPLEHKLALLRSREKVLDRPSVRTWTALHLDAHVEKRFLSSRGADLHFDYQSTGAAYTFTVGAGEGTISERWSRGGETAAALEGGDEALFERLDRCERFAAEARPVPPGEYAVVLSPAAAGIFAHESFGHRSEADSMLGDPSALESWPVGKAVGSPILSIVDHGAAPGRGYVPFDDEGQPAKKSWLIRDGLLRARLHSATTAAAFDEACSGNGRALSFAYEPIVRMTNTWIEPGGSSKEELFAGVQDGLFIETVKHGSGMSTFTIAPSLAWRIRGGQLAEPARISVITGTVFETLREIDGLSDALEMEWPVTGGCGKRDQMPLPVAYGGPYVRVRRMKVA